MELLKSKKLKTEALSDVKEKESIGNIASITLLSIALHCLALLFQLLSLHAFCSQGFTQLTLALQHCPDTDEIAGARGALKTL